MQQDENPDAPGREAEEAAGNASEQQNENPDPNPDPLTCSGSRFLCGKRRGGERLVDAAGRCGLGSP